MTRSVKTVTTYTTIGVRAPSIVIRAPVT